MSVDVRLTIAPTVWRTVPDLEAQALDAQGLVLEAIPPIGVPVTYGTTTVDGGTPAARGAMVQPRAGTAAEWAAAEPALANEELGYVSDEGTLVVGDGTPVAGRPRVGDLRFARKAAPNTFTDKQTFKRAAGSNEAVVQVVDSSDNPRFTHRIITGTATQLHVYGADGEPAILGLIGTGGRYGDVTVDPSTGNMEIDAEGGNLSLRPLSADRHVLIWGITSNPKLRVGSQGFGAALDLHHDGTNAHISATSGYIGVAGDKVKVLPSGAIDYTGPTATAATTGTNGAPPAQVAGYLTWQIDGTTVKIPYYLA